MALKKCKSWVYNGLRIHSGRADDAGAGDVAGCCTPVVENVAP
jgi:hypothetical protein